MDLETRYWRAMKDKDADLAATLTDDVCLLTGAQGASAIGRDYLPKILAGGSWDIQSFKIGEDFQVRLLTDDVAVVAYTVHEKLTVDEEPVAFDAADASTWVRRNGRWLCALHTESILGDPYGRDRKKSS